MTQIDLYKGAPSPFWTFSLAVYGRKGVPPACLTLQDSSGVDVNVLLFSLFLGSQGRALSAADVGDVVEMIEPWRRDVVVSLRAARRALKEPPAPFEGPAVEALRKSAKAAELEAERIQQEMLFVSFPSDSTGKAGSGPAKACADNVEAYRSLLGTTFDGPAVATLLEAVAATLAASRGEHA
ncbi:MAG: hypothetical protein JWL62_2820 [Hyphomicrobiales bacterium]|nr:hypothetical protein [Hyphomicrobiales bacterium]